jgi:hypothetical protein
MPSRTDRREAFRLSYSVNPETQCWEWNKSTDRGGYGKFWYQGRIVAAHRAAWILHRGTIPPGAFVCHRCDVPGCVNPKHLFLGDHRRNMADMVGKGRQKQQQGESNPRAMLCGSDVRAIWKLRKKGLGAKRIAKLLALPFGSVCGVVHQGTWAHLRPR